MRFHATWSVVRLFGLPLFMLLWQATPYAHDDHKANAAPAKVDRVVAITASDTQYDIPGIDVKAGETIRFVVTNKGQVTHEFVIADAAEQAEHEKMMQSMPGMVMSGEENAIALKPGETKQLIWKATAQGIIEFACHQPGHYALGMVGKVRVKS